MSGLSAWRSMVATVCRSEMRHLVCVGLGSQRQVAIRNLHVLLQSKGRANDSRSDIGDKFFSSAQANGAGKVSVSVTRQYRDTRLVLRG
jgi:hypothetical protein